jgi:hypothetical protein
MASSAYYYRLLAFEQVQASTETSLLRVEIDLGDTGDEPLNGMLLVDDGTVSHRFKPLPAPSDPSESMRMAFAVPLELLERQQSMSLELAHELLKLPTPTPTTGRPVDDGTPAPPPPDRPERRLAGYELIARQSEQLSEMEAALGDVEHRLEAEVAARVAAVRTAESLGSQLRQAQVDAAAQTRQLRERCAELERELAVVLAELQAVNDSHRQASVPQRTPLRRARGPVRSTDAP